MSFAVLCFMAPLLEGYADYHYSRPFLQPLPIWNYWPVLIVPLCVGVAIVYKSIKCRHIRQVPREATILSIWILAGMGATAVALLLLVKIVAWSQS